MTDSEPNLQQILAALQQATQSITALNSKVEKQNEIIEALQTKQIAPKADLPLTEQQEFMQMKDQYAKMLEQNNKFHAEQKSLKQAAALKQGLLDRGIDPKRVEHAYAFYRDKVKTDKTGTIKMVDSSGIENDLNQALDHYMEQEDAQFYKAPVAIHGGGTGPVAPGQVASRTQQPAFGYKSNKTEDLLSANDFNRWVTQTLNIV